MMRAGSPSNSSTWVSKSADLCVVDRARRGGLRLGRIVDIPDLQRTRDIATVRRQEPQGVPSTDAGLREQVIELIAFRQQLREPVPAPPGVLSREYPGERHEHGQHTAVRSESLCGPVVQGDVEGPRVGTVQVAEKRVVQLDGEPHSVSPHCAVSSTPVARKRSKTLRA